jgi:hypothetical protein
MATEEKQEGTEVINWEKQLEADAAIAAKQEENTSTGTFFGLKAGQLTWDGEAVKGNSMVCIILGSIHENVYYTGAYDPEVRQGPKCYAFGHDEKILKPHEKVFEAGNEENAECTGCPQNEWGSALKGKGKACRNTRRLAIIVAGTLTKSGDYELFEDTEHFETTTLGFMKLPVTSTKGFASYVKSAAGVLRRPPYALITKVSVTPDTDTQFKVNFEAFANVPNELMPAIMKRRAEAVAAIEFPYGDYEAPEAFEQASKTEKPASKAAQKPAAKKKY